MSILSRPSRSLRGAIGAFAFAIASIASSASIAAAAAAESPADLVMPPLTDAAPARSAWPELGVATREAAPFAARSPGASPLRAAQPAFVSAAADWAFESNVAFRTVGMDLTPAGDLNGDGISDFAALGDVNSFHTALYIFFGSAAGPVLAPGFPVIDLPPGAGLAAAGDVNNDGRDDLAMFWYGNGNLRLYFGSASGLDLVSFNTLNAHFAANMFGLHGGPAGDVNGDGFGDIIFGMPTSGGTWPCGVSPNSGMAEVMYGSATGLVGANDWLVTGCYATGAGAGLGTSVAGAGDVNGDGYDDVVIGAPGADLALVGTVGKVYVIYGSATGLPLLPGFANLGSVVYGTTIAGQHLFGTFGNTVAPAGDLNGDGYADIAVGAPYDDNYGTDSGMAFVFRGSAAGVDTATANLLWWESSGAPNSKFGISLASAGDVNGDGRGDLLVGETSRIDLAQSAGGTLLIQQLLPYTNTNTEVHTAGDVNGDGLSDMLVGDPYYANGESGEGRVLVHYGVGSPPSNYPNWSVTQSAIDNPNLGWSVNSVGDVNGDGYDDVLVGEPTWYNFTQPGDVDNGLAQLYYGHPTGLSPSSDWYVYGASGDQLGISVAGADVNGDGFSDLVIGAHAANGATGYVHIWYGSSSGPVSGPGLLLPGFTAGSYFGAWVAGAGDVNGDGYPDIIVGAPNGVDPISPLTQEGRAYVYRGSAAGLVTTPIWSRSGLQANAHLGTCVAGAGDVNGDGFADVIIGAPDFDTVNKFGAVFTDAGRFYVVFGSTAGPSAVVSPTNFIAGWRYGACVAGAGDVNGDGLSDVLIGAPGATNTISGEGAARVVMGSLSGIGATLWTQYGGEVFGAFGSSVSSAGDVDGDGLSDVLVGAVFQDMGGPQDQGRAYVYRGPLPAGASPFWTASGGTMFANMGHSLANAGDVNGDGWSDLVLGMPGYNGTGYRQGLSRVYYGAQGAGSFQLGLGYHFTAPTHRLQADCLSDPGGIFLISTARSAAGRSKVRLQYRVSPALALPAPVVNGFTTWTATGAPGSNGSLAAIFAGASPLTNGVPYSWQMRTLARNVYFPTGPWRSPARSGRLETDFRVPGAYLDVADGSTRDELLLADVRPNPMSASTSVVFSLARAGNVSLAVHDVQGRRVRVLAHTTMAAGEHRVTWDGMSDDGRSLSAGIYLVRLETEGRVLSRKVVRVR
jgi:hypothetical protein